MGARLPKNWFWKFYIIPDRLINHNQKKETKGIVTYFKD